MSEVSKWAIAIGLGVTLALGAITTTAPDVAAQFKMSRAFFDVPGTDAQVEVTDRLKGYRGSIQNDAVMFTDAFRNLTAAFVSVEKLSRKNASGKIMTAVEQVVTGAKAKGRAKKKRVGKARVVVRSGQGNLAGRDVQWTAYAFTSKKGAGVVAIAIAPQGAKAAHWKDVLAFAQSVTFH